MSKDKAQSTKLKVEIASGATALGSVTPHHIISRSVFVGLDRAVTEIREAIQAGRNN